ncbi:hypothetical protein [Candidatus Palauibacter sp.]|uniref:hypothetical protein n=1 Tax=Candidatus Palauibacter sp. TaxID=3101350 RepID=UPI003B525009
MKTNATTTAVAALLALALAACGDATPPPDITPFEAPEVTSALDWIEDSGTEFGAAPFSPPGWPYRIGYEMPHDTLFHLYKRFPGFHGINAVMWVNGLAFGAAFNLDYPGPGAIYEGHFPMKVYRDWYEDNRRHGVGRPLPPGANVEQVLGGYMEAHDSKTPWDSLDVLRARWHEPLEARTYKDGRR